MENIIMCAVIIISFIIFVKFYVKSIKKAETLIEKIMDSLMGAVLLVIVVIYYIDRYDIPSSLGLTDNIDAQNWLNVIGNYVTGIISSIIGASISLFIMRYQIDENNENTQKRDKDNLRIQNMPLFKYKCVSKDQPNTRIISLCSIYNQEESVVADFNISIKNIGLNTTRKIYLIINSETLKQECCLDLNNYGIIEKNQKIVLPFAISLKTKNTYFFDISVYYEDLLQNIYEQKVLLKYELLSINDGLNYQYLASFVVGNEQIVDSIPKKDYEII